LRVHPNVFHGALERLPVAGWQVIDERGRLRVLLAEAGAVDLDAVKRSTESALATVGVAGVAIRVEAVDSIPRTALGKAPLIRRAGRTPVAAAAH
jgi:phenylacetate-CoA ligase